ncbi:MAG: hypothetical protein U5P41_15455 [Gammaproteobacteria bacterium]|nr:hypothetical protein [Gammaproteobacteria bacterium]
MQTINLKTLIISAVMLGLLAGCTTMTRHYSEIGTPDLDYIAMIRTNRANSSEVVYNSEICKEIGEACGFFRSQAYAHLPLNHRPFLPPDHYAASHERAADCWAARNAGSREVAAAVQLLSDRERYQGLPITGDPAARAERIKACAMEAGNWSGNT